MIKDKDNMHYFMLADLHGMTSNQKDKIKDNVIKTYAMYKACGIENSDNVKIFCQSLIPEHAELTWILSTYTRVGELFRMTQFKDKSKKDEDMTNAGLLFYPILMAADILLYDTHFVPVGDDQKQHLELTRNIAQMFNKAHGDVFTIPDIKLSQSSRIMSLMDGTKKMSKSDENDNSRINLIDTEEVVRKKIASAKTDSIRFISPHLINDLDRDYYKSYEDAIIKFDTIDKNDINEYARIAKDSLYGGEIDDEIKEKAFQYLVQDCIDDIILWSKECQARNEIHNLFQIYSSLSGISFDKLIHKWNCAEKHSMKAFKDDIADILAKELLPIQKKYQEYMKDEPKLWTELIESSNYCKKVANNKINVIKKKMNLCYE